MCALFQEMKFMQAIVSLPRIANGSVLSSCARTQMVGFDHLGLCGSSEIKLQVEYTLQVRGTPSVAIIALDDEAEISALIYHTS